MKIAEFQKVKTMTYMEYCDYLQGKYGVGRADYMTRAFNKNHKVSRTSDGLIAHHKAEDKMILLSTKSVAEKCPYEWQLKENIVYCDYLEHLLLHVLICKHPSPVKHPLADVGVGGVINFIVPELNDLYSGWVSKQEWRNNCHRIVIKDKEVYLEILRMFIAYLQDERGFEDKELLHTSFNEQYGGWARKQNMKLYKEIDNLWKNKKASIYCQCKIRSAVTSDVESDDFGYWDICCDCGKRIEFGYHEYNHYDGEDHDDVSMGIW